MKNICIVVNLISILFIGCFYGFSQSKKEQLENLNFQIDSITIVLNNERAINQSLSVEYNLKINRLESDNSILLENNNRISNELMFCTTNLDTKSKEINTIKDSINTANERHIYSYYAETDDKFLFIDFLIIEIQGNEIRGICHSAAQGEWSTCFNGKKVGENYLCNEFETTTSFMLRLDGNTIHVLGAINGFHNKLEKNTKNLFFSGQVWSKPGVLSAHEVIGNLDGDMITIIGLGPYEVAGDEVEDGYNIWYEIKSSKGIHGWIFGGINALSLEREF
jgi:hypothetical protein